MNEIKMNKESCSFAVFPFLRTKEPVSIGELKFRSTDDTSGLSGEQANYVREIAAMLFLQDNLRIKSASYAIIPFVDLDQATVDLGHLENIQAFVAYCYASPHSVFGTTFLSTEHASMAVFTPGTVPGFCVRPDFHVEATEAAPQLDVDANGQVEGYAGLFNFRHHFWVTKSSRLYGPLPHPTLNHSQDLSLNFRSVERGRTDYRFLGQLLKKPETRTSTRFFTAVRWFNAANSAANDDAKAIVDLAIAFEALFVLPRDHKTDRFIETIYLLLGRIPRLDVWAQQFYEVRSHIVHEGYVHQLRFVATDKRKPSEGPLCQSLVAYGRHIFQLCLGTLLAGYELAEKVGMEDKLVTNEERFQSICKVLADETIDHSERLSRIIPVVTAIEQYRFVSESGLLLTTMIVAVKLTCKNLLEENKSLPQDMKARLEQVVKARRMDDHFEEIDALHNLDGVFPDTVTATEENSANTVRRFVKVVWGYVFMHYFWLKEQKSKQPS